MNRIDLDPEGENRKDKTSRGRGNQYFCYYKPGEKGNMLKKKKKTKAVRKWAMPGLARAEAGSYQYRYFGLGGAELRGQFVRGRIERKKNVEDEEER